MKTGIFKKIYANSTVEIMTVKNVIQSISYSSVVSDLEVFASDERPTVKKAYEKRLQELIDAEQVPAIVSIIESAESIDEIDE